MTTAQQTVPLRGMDEERASLSLYIWGTDVIVNSHWNSNSAMKELPYHKASLEAALEEAPATKSFIIISPS